MTRIPHIVVALLLAAIVLVAGRNFLAQRVAEPLFPSASLKVTWRLSDYEPRLRNTRGDTEVFVFEGAQPGGTVLVLGGTHPNEPAGYIAAYLLLENITLSSGRVIIIPRANNSAFTHTDPGEATPATVSFHTDSGDRSFRIGSRISNPLDQWPDPEVYLHFPSRQALSGSETRNLNRCFPGRVDGMFTERVALAITEVVKREKVDLVIDMHEASPEYPVINAIVAHQRALDLAAFAHLNLQAHGLQFALEPSPENFHGLSHRELGDATPALATLMETANIAQGRLRGAMSAESVILGRDKCYAEAATAGLVRVPYDSTGISLASRVARHLAGVKALTEALAFTDPAKSVVYSGIPSPGELEKNGLGDYLNSSHSK